MLLPILLMVYSKSSYSLPIFTLKPIGDKPWNNVPKNKYTGKHQILMVQGNLNMYKQEVNILEMVNLEAITNQLKTIGTNCHILIDNYLGVNISPLDLPVILRKSVPGIFVANFRPSVDYATIFPHVIFWYPANYLSFLNISASHHSIEVESEAIEVDCPTSESVLKLETVAWFSYIDDSCIRLDFFKHSSTSKPWACQIQIEIFLPDTYIRHGIMPPPLFQYKAAYLNNKVRRRPYYFALPCAIKTVHVLVEKLLLLKQKWFPEIATEISWDYFYEDGMPLVRHDEYFVALVADVTSQSSTTLKVLELSVRLISRSDNNFYYIFGIQNRTIPFVFTENFKVLVKEHEIQNALWKIRGESDAHPNNILSLVNHFLMCENYLWPTSKVSSIANLKFEDPQDKLAHGVISIWLAILNNFTIPSRDNTCVMGQKHSKNEQKHFYYYSGIIHPRSNIRNGSQIYPFFFQESINDLGFVSCGGTNGVDKVSFKEFTVIYNSDVWVFILVSVVLMAIFNRLFVKPKHSFIHSLLITFKYLLEQGTDFSSSIKQLLYSNGAFLLMGVVISNAYKNTNVYNMISPRGPKPYEKILELLRDNFSMMTRSHTIHLHLETIERNWNDLRLRVRHNFSVNRASRHRLEGRSFFYYLIQSPLSHLQVVLNSLPSNETNLFDTAYNKSDFHVEFPSMLGKTIRKNWPTWNVFNKTLAKVHFENIKKLIIEEENKLVYEFLRGCNKTALLLSMMTCNKFAKNLQLSGVEENVFVGTEKTFRKVTMIEIYGHVHQHVIRRIKWVTASGLFDWWVHVTSTTSKPSKFVGAKVLRAPNMNGNVQLIFLLLIMGTFISCFSCFVEIVLQKCKSTRHSMSIPFANFRYMYYKIRVKYN